MLGLGVSWIWVSKCWGKASRGKGWGSAHTGAELSVRPTCFSEEFCEIFRAKDKTTGKLHTCKKFQKRDGRKVRKAAKNEIGILKMCV